FCASTGVSVILLVVRRRILLSASSSLYFSDPAPTAIYPLSLHDALPISRGSRHDNEVGVAPHFHTAKVVSKNALLLGSPIATKSDRKSTRLNSSHVKISYAVFCLKKKKEI